MIDSVWRWIHTFVGYMSSTLLDQDIRGEELVTVHCVSQSIIYCSKIRSFLFRIAHVSLYCRSVHPQQQCTMLLFTTAVEYHFVVSLFLCHFQCRTKHQNSLQYLTIPFRNTYSYSSTSTARIRDQILQYHTLMSYFALPRNHVQVPARQLAHIPCLLTQTLRTRNHSRLCG
jgi:hypothetical protein